MEDEVLANAGVDVFEEVFKLIFTKLYDEHKSQEDRHMPPSRWITFTAKLSKRVRHTCSPAVEAIIRSIR